ncbi:hypothetical protein [Amycolatopsis magusensis]|uniref:hypothetical protein n=1 Tax=Amycolatopsis magusensis TaxID=882444 RepID=UPI00379E18AD
MAKLTYEQERLHAQACQLIDLNRDLTEEERAFVLDHWRASSTTRSASDRAYFTPAGLARDLSLHVGGDRIIDLAAGIGRLAFHCRDLWARWPHPGPEFVCIERNPEYLRVGRRVMPEARWICADIMTIPALREEIGEFDCAISNPPFGAIPRAVTTTSGYRGRRFEYHAIALAAMVARCGVFLIPQVAAPFRYSGVPEFESGTGDAEYRKFAAATGIELVANCGIDTTQYQHDWHDVAPLVEIVRADFTERAPVALPVACRGAGAASAEVAGRAGQLALLAL